MSNDPRRFTWRGINFLWRREEWPHFTGTQAVTGTYATVAPEGLAWSACVRIGGGSCQKQVRATRCEHTEVCILRGGHFGPCQS